MKIFKRVQSIPGGLMVVPLLLGAIVNTFAPQLIEIGGFTEAMFKTGTSAILGLFLFCNGSQINLKEAGEPLVKGVLLTAVKFILGGGIGIIINRALGSAGLFGIVPVAIVGALSNSNGGLYAALASEYGSPEDVGAISILSVNDGPFLTMVALGASGIASVPYIALVATVVPIIIGMILGNLDEDIREFLAPATTILIPFFAFPLGASLNLGQLVEAGLPGLLLGVMCTLITGTGGYLAMKAIRSENPQVGAAIGTTAGNAAATPQALAEVDPTMAAIAGVATIQITAAIIVTAILCPIYVNYLNKIETKRVSA